MHGCVHAYICIYTYVYTYTCVNWGPDNNKKAYVYKSTDSMKRRNCVYFAFHKKSFSIAVMIFSRNCRYQEESKEKRFKRTDIEKKKNRSRDEDMKKRGVLEMKT